MGLAITPILSTELIRIATNLDNKRKYYQKENLGKIPLSFIALNFNINVSPIKSSLQFISILK